MERMLSTEDLKNYIDELIYWDALELSLQAGTETTKPSEVLIPYLMNDAVEYYIRLTNASLHGSLAGIVKEAVFTHTQEPDRNGIFFYTKEGGVISVWYDQAIYAGQCYQYHRIGHAWRDEKGEEHIRRLVNLLCVLHDKFEYLGENGCTIQEEELSRLIEFAPLCYFTPINLSIETWYPETREGILAMEKLARECGDEVYAGMIQEYLKVWESLTEQEKSTKENNLAKQEKSIKANNYTKAEKSTKANNHAKRDRLKNQLSEALLRPEHGRIFWTLQEKIEEASLVWPERKYSEEQQDLMEEKRREIESNYKLQGYIGTYPLMKKENIVFFAEEHPFTIMESEEYRFQIFEIPLGVQFPGY